MTTPAVTAAPASEPTHPCVRCGREVALDVSLCENCNPLGLEQPATSQVHGTVFAAILLGFVALAVAGRLVLSGIGPFTGQVRDVSAAANGLVVTLAVQNDGSKEGTATCRLTVEARRGVGTAVVVQSPRVAGGELLEFTTTTDRFGTDPVPLAVACTGP